MIIKLIQATYNIHPLLLGAKRTSFILEGRIIYRPRSALLLKRD
jgi:hypothetical protein